MITKVGLDKLTPLVFKDVDLRSASEKRQTWTVTINLYWLNHGDSAYVTLPRIDGDINKQEDLFNAVEQYLIEKGHFVERRNHDNKRTDSI